MQTSLGEIYCNVVAVWVKIVLETAVHNHYPIPYGGSPYKNDKVQKASQTSLVWWAQLLGSFFTITVDGYHIQLHS